MFVFGSQGWSHGEAQQCHPQWPLQEGLAVLREDVVQPARSQEEKKNG
jgi:hypothetical protein